MSWLIYLSVYGVYFLALLLVVWVLDSLLTLWNRGRRVRRAWAHDPTCKFMTLRHLLWLSAILFIITLVATVLTDLVVNLIFPS